MDGVLLAVRESFKQYERRQADLEEAEAKYLGMKKVWGSVRESVRRRQTCRQEADL